MQAWWAEETSLKKNIKILLLKNFWLVEYIVSVYGLKMLQIIVTFHKQ